MRTDDRIDDLGITFAQSVDDSVRLSHPIDRFVDLSDIRLDIQPLIKRPDLHVLVVEVRGGHSTYKVARRGLVVGVDRFWYWYRRIR